MLADLWPLAALRLTSRRLTLRPPDEAGLVALAGVAAAGVHRPHERPFLTPWTDLPPDEQARSVLQGVWKAWGDWTPQVWALHLGVFLEDRPLGMVTVRAREFRVLREVTTSSWLGLEHQGQGYGTEARAALLTLAFGGLNAEAALSVVFQDNAASQGVSRRLGYVPDGVQRDVLNGRAVVSDRLRLTRAAWQAAPRPPVEMTGLEACRPLFGDV
jgi:RimJ/RimL family protein N-acetyltransferase